MTACWRTSGFVRRVVLFTSKSWQEGEEEERGRRADRELPRQHGQLELSRHPFSRTVLRALRR